MGVNSISFGSPRVRPMWALSTCGEPDEIKTNPHPVNTTARLRGQAGFNFNDGLGGGDEVHDNLIFNSCRETSDHGPINSWDRQPYVATF